MGILERYIGRSILMGTVVVLIVLLTLLGVFELMKNLDDVGVGQYGTVDAFVGSLLTLPRRMFEIFPVAALVGSLLGLGVLANSGELTAMRSAGVSINALIVAVLKTGLLMLIFVFVIGEYVGPVSEAYVQKVELEKKQQKITLKSQNGFWARDGQEFINIRTILPGSELQDIYIYKVEPDKQVSLATYAKSARYIDGKWQLQDILQTSVNTTQTKSRAIETASWASMIDPELLSVIVVEPNMLTAKGLYSYMTFMNSNGQDASRYEVAFWNKIFTPLTTVVMLVLSVPFVLGSLRESSVGHRVFVGTLIGTLFFVTKDTIAHLSLVYAFEPLLGATLPALVMALAGYFLIRRISQV